MIDKAKILHIGRTDTPHVCDVLEQIKKYTDFNNVLISCKTTRFMNEEFFRDIPVYDYDYLRFSDGPQMRAVVDAVISTEKPDIVVGYSFSQIATILNYVLTIRNIPSLVFIWSSKDCIRDIRNTKSKGIYYNNLSVLNKINYLLTTNKVLTRCAVIGYGIDNTDFVETCPPVNLAQYTDHVLDVSRPRLLLGKARCEQHIFGSLPFVFRAFPNLEVHAFATPLAVALARQHKVYNKVTFHPFPLSQENFADLIKRCNIVYTVTADPGTGNTAMQASYAGCINLMRRCSTSAGIIEDKRNAIMCQLTVQDVTRKLIYSIKNLAVLCKQFKENNNGLIQYDRENTWKVFHEAIVDCLEGKKAKIAPRVKTP